MKLALNLLVVSVVVCFASISHTASPSSPSGKTKELLHERHVLDDGVPCVRRFSGGGILHSYSSSRSYSENITVQGRFLSTKVQRLCRSSSTSRSCHMYRAFQAR